MRMSPQAARRLARTLHGQEWLDLAEDIVERLGDRVVHRLNTVTALDLFFADLVRKHGGEERAGVQR